MSRRVSPVKLQADDLGLIGHNLSPISNIMPMIRAAIVVLGCLLLGCGSAAEQETRTSATVNTQDVRTIIAKQLGRSATSIKSNATFAQLGADDLDIVEIILEVEESLGITIDDERLVTVAGAADPEELRTRLTVRKFEQVVAESAK